MEWATPRQGISIHLLRKIAPYDRNRIALEHILFRRDDLPCDLECQAYQVTSGEDGELLPLGALLAALYRDNYVGRTIFNLLNELTALVPITSRVTAPVREKGLLVEQAERLGYRLNTLFKESGAIYTQIGWEPRGLDDRLHVCSAAFRSGGHGRLDNGEWLKSNEIGVSEVLTTELRRLVPGGPRTLLTETAIQLLQKRSQEDSG